MLGRDLQLKTTTLLVFFLWFAKSFKRSQIISLLIFSRNMTFFLISCTVSGLLNELQIFWLYLLIGMGLGILVLISQYQVLWDFVCQVLSWFSVFFSRRSLQIFPDRNLHKNIQLMIEFPAFLLLYPNDLSDVICNIAIYADETTLYCEIRIMHLICGNN